MNHHVFEQLSGRFEVNLIEGVNPPMDFLEKSFSKFMRILGFEGSYAAFSQGRLTRIRKSVERRMDPAAVLSFYHGATPWVLVRNNSPYAVYLDACFGTYVNTYHNSRKFNQLQLERLYELERLFLEQATAVFFSSQWALNDTLRRYRSSGSNFHVAGLGGNLSVQPLSRVIKEKYFLFVGLDFMGKGGETLVNAFVKVRDRFPDVRLKIAGDRPPARVRKMDGVVYEGYIDKSTAIGAEKLAELFAKSSGLILPTNKDLTPLVLVEAGMYKCPAITVRKFGIPEMVIDGETGFLLDSEGDICNELVEKMIFLCENEKEVYRMGEVAYKHVVNKFSWELAGLQIIDVLNQKNV